MTVAELTERLRDLPPDVPVVACVKDGEEVRDVKSYDLARLAVVVLI